MEHQTGFVQFDGRRIAYAAVGDGPLLVSMRVEGAETLVVATVA